MATRGLLLIFFLSGSLMARTIYAEYIANIDGDTILFESNKKEFICNLYGVDAPELHTSKKLIQDSKKTFVSYDKTQSAGMESYIYLAESLSKKIDYKVVLMGKNCMVYAPKHKSSINEKIIFDGYATVDQKKIKSQNLKHRLLRAQSIAKNDRSGLWGSNYNIMNGLSSK